MKALGIAFRLYDLLAIDPGKKLCGWAAFAELVDGSFQLVDCGLWRVNPKLSRECSAPFARVVMLEKPQIYSSRVSKGDPNDLVDIAVRGAWLAASMAPKATLVTRLPREWKGTVDPEVMLDRIKDRLSAWELGHLDRCGAPPSLMHNVIDAIGLGLHGVGRL